MILLSKMLLFCFPIADFQILLEKSGKGRSKEELKPGGKVKSFADKVYEWVKEYLGDFLPPKELYNLENDGAAW